MKESHKLGFASSLGPLLQTLSVSHFISPSMASRSRLEYLSAAGVHSDCMAGPSR